MIGAAGEWSAIDRFTALECVLSPCGHITKVPEALRTDWAIANTQVFDRIEQARHSGNARDLDRALKWQLCLHDIMLRGPSRTTRGAGKTIQQVACRFEAWRRGDREQLITWWEQDRARALRRKEGRVSGADASGDEQQRKSERALLLIHEGELAKAMRVLDSNGVAGLTVGVLRQLQAKHPGRSHPVPNVLPGTFPAYK